MGKRNKKKRNKNKYKNDLSDNHQQTLSGGTGGRTGGYRGDGEEGKGDGRRHRSRGDEKDLSNPTNASAAVKLSSTGGDGGVQANGNNPLLVEQRKFLQKEMTSKERDYFFDNTKVSPTRRAELWMEQAEIGERLVNKFSWATPTETSFRVLRHFSPLVEMGCGSNAYWIRQLLEWDHDQQQKQQQNGDAKPIDIIGFDGDIHSGGKISSLSAHKKDKNMDDKKTMVLNSSPGKNFIVQRGGPEVLSDPQIVNKDRSLFLCYPDDEDIVIDGEDNGGTIQSFGWNCLDNFQGQYIIHVGELIMADNNLSYDQAPWGRSSSPEFQQRLMSEYHCIYKITLPNWVHVRDTLTVWKRTELCTMVFAASDDEDNHEDGNQCEEEEAEEEVHYRHIPPDEILPVNVAAPCMSHLLPQVLSTNTDKKVGGLLKTTEKGTKKDQLQNQKHRKRKHPDKDVQSYKHAKASNSSRQDRHDYEDVESDGSSDSPIINMAERGAHTSPW